MDAGHVFVTAGDLMALACDAWLVPGAFGAGATWHRALPPEREWRPYPSGWGQPGAPRAFLLAEAPEPEPLPFLCDIVGHDRAPEWWVAGAREFVRVAARTLAERRRGPVFGRARHLVALPLVGTGGGGAIQHSGELVHLLLGALRDEAARAGVDVALVLLHGPAWAAAQNERKADTAAFPELPAHLVRVCDHLAAVARSGDLVLFLGAGLSQAVGLPGWSELLADLAVEYGGFRGDEQDALRALGELDRAAVLQKRLPSDEPLGVAAARLLARRARRHGLGHALLASLPVDEVVTTNYDDLFERASAVIDRPCTILPGGQVVRGQRWILKMHGRVDRPETIVLTREDFMKFQASQVALAGIVQALLLTRHMLFVGFSFTDDNFHRIAHAVRQAIGRRQRFGTTLLVDPNPLARELWSEDFDWITFPAGERMAQARLLEIFLDRLACHAATATSHLGDRRYEGALSPGERALRDRLTAFLASVGEEERATAAWADVARLLERLGIGGR